MAERKIGAGAGMAALRQGAKELAAMTKAFPDSIAIDEPGTLLSPTQGEIAESNRNGSIFGRLQEGRERTAPKNEAPRHGLDRD